MVWKCQKKVLLRKMYSKTYKLSVQGMYKSTNWKICRDVILVSVIKNSARSHRRPCFVILPTDDVLSQPPHRPRPSSSLKVIVSKARQTDKFSLTVLYHFYSLIQLAGLKTKEVFSALESNRIGSSRRGQWMDSGIRAANKTCDLYGCYCGSVTVLWQSRPIRAHRACA